MRSTSRRISHQALPCPPASARLYVATSAGDVVDYGLSLDWMLSLMTEMVTESGDDLALWLIEDKDAPRIVAVVRPAPSGSVTVQIL